MSPAEDLARLHAAAMTSDRAWRAQEFAGLIKQKSAVLIHRPEGFAIGRQVLDEAELLMLAVAFDHQRQGHGTDLLAQFEGCVAHRGGLRIFLEVAEDNAPARALYDRAGYRMAGRRAGYYARGASPAVAALICEKAIRSA